MARRRKDGYFEPEPGAPAPRRASVRRAVRFEEVDPLGIVWHGRYPSYLEDGRVAFGARYGLEYLRMRDEGFAAPVVQMHLDYHAPLRFGESCEIEAALHWCDAARLNFEYRVTRLGDDAPAASGYTVQMLTDLSGEVLVAWPEYLERWREAWRREAAT